MREVVKVPTPVGEIHLEIRTDAAAHARLSLTPEAWHQLCRTLRQATQASLKEAEGE